LRVWGTASPNPLRLTWEDNIRLDERFVFYRVGKTDDWMPYPLHDEVVAELANLPGERKGKVFPWKYR
jgi:hypothetical protein